MGLIVLYAIWVLVIYIFGRFGWALLKAGGSAFSYSHGRSVISVIIGLIMVLIAIGLTVLLFVVISV